MAPAALYHDGKHILLRCQPEFMLSRAAVTEAGALQVPACVGDRTCKFC